MLQASAKTTSSVCTDSYKCSSRRYLPGECMSAIHAYKQGWHRHSVDGYVWQHGTVATFYTSASAGAAGITALNHQLVKAGT